MHWVGNLKAQITYWNGREISESSGASGAALSETIRPGMTSEGEFGPIISTVFHDMPQGQVAWSRWEPGQGTARLAVFTFSVPKPASHYLVDFCCYSRFDDRDEELPFRETPAYHGEMVLDPDSGTIRRIVIDADLEESAPVVSSAIVVDYGDVEIGGSFYISPIRSVAITSIRNRQMERLDGIGIERHLNEVSYLDYHKFGSTSRMLQTAQ